MTTTLANTRCYLVHVVKMISELKKQMNRQHQEILRGTPLPHFMDMAPVMQDKGVLNALLQVYDNRNQRFKLGESILSFRVEDVALILGLYYDEDIVSFKNERVQSKFEHTFLNKMHNRHYDVTKKTYLGLYEVKAVRRRHL